MIIRRKIKYNCPYCGAEISHFIGSDKFNDKGEILYCDSEDGGCGRRYLIDVAFNISYSIKTIEP